MYAMKALCGLQRAVAPIGRLLGVAMLAVAAARSPHAAAAPAAAVAETANVSRIHTDIVAPADVQAYEAAVRHYVGCLREHASPYRRLAWRRETGNTHVYRYATGPYTWADFDALDKKIAACAGIVAEQAKAALVGESEEFLIGLPEITHGALDKDGKPALLNITLFKLKQSPEADDTFTTGLQKIVAAADKSKWPGQMALYKVRGGAEGASDYVLASPYRDWADLGAGPKPGAWAMAEAVYGKVEVDTMRAGVNAAIERISAHVERYIAELSYVPETRR